MADRLNGYRILILETREEAQFSRLLTEQGADVLQCPMFTIHDAPDPAPVEAWIGRSIERPFDDVVLLTGEGLRRLMKAVRLIGVGISGLGQPIRQLGLWDSDHEKTRRLQQAMDALNEKYGRDVIHKGEYNEGT